MLPNFVYLPPEGEKKGRFLNLSLVTDIEEIELKNRFVLWGSCGEEIATISGEQARHLRAALALQTRPELPPIPAAQLLESRLERRGVIQ